MKQKPREILELERMLVLNIRELSYDQFIDNLLSVVNYSAINTFLLSERNEIIGLNLANNNITNFNFLIKFHSLEYLNISGNGISEINFIENLNELVILNLSMNRIRDCDVLKSKTPPPELPDRSDRTDRSRQSDSPGSCQFPSGKLHG